MISCFRGIGIRLQNRVT